MTADEDVLAVARHRLEQEADAVSAVARALDGSFVSAASTLLACTGKVFTGGSGTSATVARRMAHLFSVTGTPAVFLSPMDCLHGSSGAIREADVMILISNGGASAEVIDTARIVQRLGARVMAITCAHDTPLARMADHSVVVRVDGDADLGGVVATGVTLAQAAWGDAMAEVLMRARGYTWSQFMATHPAGAVGQRSALPPELPALRLPPAGDHPAGGAPR